MKQENQDKRMDDEVLLTAYALGELEGADKEFIEARLAGDESLRTELESMRGMASMLSAEFALEAGPGLTEEQRRRVEEADSESLQAAPVLRALSPLRRWTGLSAAAAVVLAVSGMWWKMGAGSRELDVMRTQLSSLGSTQPNQDATTSLFRQLGYSDDESSDLFAGLGGDSGGDAVKFGEVLGSIGYAYFLSDGDGAIVVDFASLHSSLSVQNSLQTPALKLGKSALKRAREINLRRYSLEESENVELAGADYGLERDVRLEFDEFRRTHIIENAFILAKGQRYSTFSSDVDTASYALVRNLIKNRQPVHPSTVRIEELINYFPYDYAGPTGDEPFAVHVEVTAAPWAPEHRLLRIGIKGREIPMAERRPSNLVFLLDVSGSMSSDHKLPLLKKALEMLVRELGENDRVSIVVYAGAAGVVLPPITCDYQVSILNAIEQLNSGGSTAGGEGIELAYALAQEHFLEGGINRVILATDGDWNVGITDAGQLEELIAKKAESGIFLSVLGFGMNASGDERMERLSNRGNGTYAYIDSELEARKVLVKELGSTLETIAKDVKLQVEFNPAEVAAYRLIGYTNRMLKYEDFNNDEKDAGDIGAGHTVTALYEIVPASAGLTVPGFESTELQSPNSEGAPDEQPTTPTTLTNEFAQVNLRYKEPTGDTSRLIEISVQDMGIGFHNAQRDTRFAAAVAGFGMLLQGSEYSAGIEFEDVRRWAIEALGQDADSYREDFRGLVESHVRNVNAEKIRLQELKDRAEGEEKDSPPGPVRR